MLENCGSKTTNIIVLDLEGFKLKSLGFIIKELRLCSSYNDKIFLKPPLKFTDLLAHDRQTVIWLTNNLHGFDWDEGDILYCDLKTICLSFSLRFTRKNFFAIGIEKCELLSKFLQKTVYNLEDLNCPRISEIISEEKVPSCYRHSNFRSTNGQLSNHCAERKARIFSQWTQSGAQRRHGNFNDLSVKQLEDIHLLDSTRRSADCNTQQS